MSEQHCVDCGRIMLAGVASDRCMECAEYYREDTT